MKAMKIVREAIARSEAEKLLQKMGVSIDAVGAIDSALTRLYGKEAEALAKKINADYEVMIKIVEKDDKNISDTMGGAILSEDPENMKPLMALLATQL